MTKHFEKLTIGDRLRYLIELAPQGITKLITLWGLCLVGLHKCDNLRAVNTPTRSH